MVNRFTINNVTYTAKPFDFQMVCDLEEYGIGINDFGKAKMSFARAYFAICADVDKEDAAKEIQEHLISGGNLDGLTEAMAKEMKDSDFFRALANRDKQTEETDATTGETEKKRGRKPIEK